LALVSLGSLVAGSAGAAPVDLTDPTNRPISLISEGTPCTGGTAGTPITAGFANADCYVSGNDPAAIFDPATALPATLTFSGNMATVTIAAAVWEIALSNTLNDDGGTPADPSDDLMIVPGSVSDYVLEIDTLSGNALTWSWTATLHSGALGSDLPLEARLLDGSGSPNGTGQAFFGQVTSTTDAVAFNCGTGGVSPNSDTSAFCDGSAFLVNQAYDPATGTLVHLAGSDVIVGLTPQAWAPLDVMLLEAVPEPGTVLILGAGLLGLALLRRRRHNI
jgi:hypothetical protein